jgi:hypothetical protein
MLKRTNFTRANNVGLFEWMIIYTSDLPFGFKISCDFSEAASSGERLFGTVGRGRKEGMTKGGKERQ